MGGYSKYQKRDAYKKAETLTEKQVLDFWKESYNAYMDERDLRIKLWNTYDRCYRNYEKEVALKGKAGAYATRKLQESEEIWLNHKHDTNIVILQNRAEFARFMLESKGLPTRKIPDY